MDGGKSCRTAGKVCAGLGRGRTCRLRRRFEIAVLWGLANFGARRFPKGERKALWCARRRILIAPAGLTRRLRRGQWGCRPEGGSTFFRSERKYQRKHAARRLREKALYCPFLKEGVRNVARNEDGQLSPAFGARSCSLLSSFKKGKAFSLRCLSPLCSPAVGARHTQIAVLGMLRRSLDIFATQKTSVNIESRWPFSASHEACRRMAVFSIQLTRSYIRPASREACCRAAVKLKPSHFSSMSLRASAVTSAGL